MANVIGRFIGEYFYLSNYYEVPVTYDSLTYGSAEAAFQAQKILNLDDRKIFTTLKADDSKKMGRSVILRPDWDDVKLSVMREIIRCKFTQNTCLLEQLLKTGNALLIEGNTWHDTFWGVDLKTGLGENHLGLILMEVREEILRTSM